MRFTWSAVMLVVLAAPAFAQTADGDEKTPPSSPASAIDPLDRIDKLEKELNKLKVENEARKAGLPERISLEEQDKKEAPKSEVDFKASFTDGFHIKSTDGNFDLHVGGRLELDYRYTFNRATDGGAPRTSVNTFTPREAFIGADGTIFHDWGFKFNADLSPQAAPAGSGTIWEEFWFEWKALKEFRIMFGSFKQPMSFDTTDSPRFSEFIQRTPMSRFIPNFDTGIKIYGSFADTLFTYELAVTNGRSHLANIGRDVNDDNDGKEFAGRLTFAPFVQNKESILKGLRVGFYGSFAHVGEGNTIGAGGFPGGIATAELGVTWMAAGAFPAAPFRFYGPRSREGFEFTYAVGPFMVRAEGMKRGDTWINAAAGGHLHLSGYYGEAVWVVTGEDRIPNARIVPLNPFDLSKGTWGAVEVGVRWAAVGFDHDSLVRAGMGAVGFNNVNADRVRSITIGANWWPVQNVKFGLDYISEDYYQPIALSPAHVSSHANGMLARFQIDF